MNTQKLELKQIAPYLPFGLNILFEWHFDCFNLISLGLAIDIKTK